MAHITFVNGFKVNQKLSANIFHMIILECSNQLATLHHPNWLRPDVKQSVTLSLLPTHALQIPCQYLKSTRVYFSQRGKDQLVDHYDPIRLLVDWMKADQDRSRLGQINLLLLCYWKRPVTQSVSLKIDLSLTINGFINIARSTLCSFENCICG